MKGRPMQSELFTIPQACTSLNCGKTHLYSLINKGDLKAVKLSKKTLIPKKSIEDFIANLQPYLAAKEITDKGE